MLQQDEMQPQTLWTKRTTGRALLIHCAFFVSDRELIFYWPGATKHFDVMSLRGESSARIRYQIPKGTVINQMHVGFEKPPR